MKSIKKLMHFNSHKFKEKHSGSQSSPDSKHGADVPKEMQVRLPISLPLAHSNLFLDIVTA